MLCSAWEQPRSGDGQYYCLFLKFYWDIIKSDVTRGILHFFCSNSICESWKDTLVVLLPKTTNADTPSKFCPISLCQSFYKVVAKILINRIKPVLGNIISEEQGSSWIQALSGLRQGCPLSPYLFILCSELLSMAFKQRGAQLGIRIVPHAERISHLLYVDDILVFAEASRHNADRILNILDHYCGWTGQCINREKSAILFNKRCPKWKQRAIARAVGVRRVDQFDYLGIPLVLRKLKVADFAKIV
ncbi:putative mitochondrial protein [Dendrobium catenatum]|uniref:Putative mitochondrial protein n=1 Tax=Dendrobium catenatum TaxID=906689 RepID=A0A2I0X682_9ASPA|nr:putative mitochondrial protein [Dendrobium catenatum]